MTKRKAAGSRAAAQMVRPVAASCPCGLPAAYDRCCGRFHSGQASAGTAELLMRSRYSAFALQDAEYLLRTWHSSTRPASVGFAVDQRWTGLEIVGSTAGGLLEPTGTVEFQARYTRGGRPGAQHEVSRFVREGGRWVYLDEVN